MEVIFVTYPVWPSERYYLRINSYVIPVRGRKFMHRSYTISSDTILFKNAFQTNLEMVMEWDFKLAYCKVLLFFVLYPFFSNTSLWTSRQTSQGKDATLDLPRISERKPNRKVVSSTSWLSFWPVLFRHNRGVVPVHGPWSHTSKTSRLKLKREVSRTEKRFKITIMFSGRRRRSREERNGFVKADVVK